MRRMRRGGGVSEPILINGDTADIAFKLFTDEHHTQVLSLIHISEPTRQSN